MHHYSVRDYLAMLADQPRWQAHIQALDQALRPGMQVVEIGSGLSTLAAEALRRGASLVHCIEPNSVIHTARDLIAGLGLSDRVVFHQALSQDVSIPDRVDLVIGDTRGITPLYESHLKIMMDARDRLLQPGGALIPGRDRLWAAPIACPTLWSEATGILTRLPRGLDLEKLALHTHSKPVRIGSEHAVQMLNRAAQWATIDYQTITSADVSGCCSFQAGLAGECHGFAVWFSAELLPGVGYDNSPERRDSIYGQLYFPLSQPLSLQAGDEIRLEIKANPLAGAYFWRWTTAVFREAKLQTELAHQSMIENLPSLPELNLRQRKSSESTTL